MCEEARLHEHVQRAIAFIVKRIARILHNALTGRLRRLDEHLQGGQAIARTKPIVSVLFHSLLHDGNDRKHGMVQRRTISRVVPCFVLHQLSSVKETPQLVEVERFDRLGNFITRA